MGKGEVTPLLMDEGCAKRKPRPVTYGDRLRVSRSSSRACLRSSRSSCLTCSRSSCSSCLTPTRSSCSSWRSWSRSFSQSCSPSSSRFLPTLTSSLVDSSPLERSADGFLLSTPGVRQVHATGRGPGLCRMLDANFYEKALFVKPTWRPPEWSNPTAFCPSHYVSENPSYGRWGGIKCS